MTESPNPSRAVPAHNRSWGRGVLWAILCVGLGVALWPLGQAAFGWWSQRALRQNWQREWQTQEAQAKAQAARARNSRKYLGRQAHQAYASQHAAPQPWPATRIIIPSIGLDAVVVSGVSEEALKRGPGHDPASSLPGQGGNCVIAAHRNAFGWWFYKLNALGTNAGIELRTPRASHFYALSSTRILPETATWALRPPTEPNAAPRLTLYTCALPHGSQRVVVTARLIRTQPAS